MSVSPEQVLELRELARRIRVHSLRMTQRAKSSHVASSMSMAEILAVLYRRILRLRPESPDASDRDRLILSKGHACAGLYAVLAECGFFPLDWLDSFYIDGAKLPGHATADGIPGVEISTGSLGHGLPVACGMALAAKRDGRGHRVFAVLSDGECDEGSNWEAILFAPQHELDNLVVIVDYNKIQSLASVKEVLELEPFVEKWRAFRWAVREVDGHDVAALIDLLAGLPFEPGRPSCLIAHTVKGKGVSFMENTVLWHYRSPQGQEFERALAELNAQA
ncbi:MAG: transketolase [Thermoguttaceae bacterium]|jgi:transketolase